MKDEREIMASSSQTQGISEWAARLKWEDLPDTVAAQAKRCFRDSVACAAGGARSQPGRIARQAALQWGGFPEASVIGAARMVNARNAGFANATMSNALDFDDTLHGHPGATVFPAALAAAEKWHASGREFLLAAVLGYEISIRAMTLMEPLIPRYKAMWDLGTLQAFGSAAAAARLAGLDAAGISNVLGLVSGTAPVPLPRKQRFSQEGRSMLKSAYGWAVDASLVAVELTQLGFSGPGHALDDNLGFWMLARSSELGIHDFLEGLGEQWAILNVEFKPYMACRFIHPVLQGVEELLRRRRFSLDEVRQVEVFSFSLLTDEHHYILEPVSLTDAQFSVPYTVAAMIRDGRLKPESYAENSLRDRAILELASRVRVTSDPLLESAFPSRLGARIQVELNDGYMDRVIIEHPKGSMDQPLSEPALLEKFHSLVDPLMGRDQAAHIATLIDTLEDLEDMASFGERLRETVEDPDE